MGPRVDTARGTTAVDKLGEKSSSQRVGRVEGQAVERVGRIGGRADARRAGGSSERAGAGQGVRALGGRVGI